MHYIGMMLPMAYPVDYCNLKSNKALRIIGIAINIFPVKQAINIYQKQIKTQFVGVFFNNGIIELPIAHLGATFRVNRPFILIQEFGFVHGHYHFGIVPHFVLVFWQGTHHITQSTCFCHRITFCRYMKYFHKKNLVLMAAQMLRIEMI